MSDLRSLLVEHGLRPKRMNPGAQSRLRCPACEAKDEDSFSLKIDADGQGFTGNCHRGSCGHTVGAKIKSERPSGQSSRNSIPSHQLRRYEAPTVLPEPSCAMSDAAHKWFSKRGINPDTVDDFGVYIERGRRFNGGKISDAVVFPYRYDGMVVNRKYRGVDDKGLMGQEKNPLPTLFNIESVIENDQLVWAEGEPDVMALYQCGYPQSVTLKDGAPAKLKDENDPERAEDKRFAALETHEELLAGIEKHYLAGDNDSPGLVLREELARRLGRHKCWIVTWPEGMKDANEVLLKCGAEAVQRAMDEAKPYPIEGLHEIDVERCLAYRKMPPPPAMNCGMTAVNKIIHWPSDGRVIVVTGVPNSGKSQFVMNIMAYTMRYHERKWMVFSPEMEPIDDFVIQMIEILSGTIVRPNRHAFGYEPLNDDAYRAWLNYLKHRMITHSSDAEESAPTMDQILDRGRAAVLRYGITDLLLDPFNELELARGSLSETDYIGRCLQRARAFGKRHGVNVWIVAHPAKMQKSRETGKIEAPGPYDISGSAHWANKPDLGVTIHTPNEITQVILWKSRHWRFGRKGTACEIEYEKVCGRYIDRLEPGQQPSRSWYEPKDD